MEATPYLSLILFWLILLPNLLLCLLMVDSVSSTRRVLGNETDQLSLLAFKVGIDQDPLGALNSWNDSLHFCEWEGVTCGSRHRRVTMLSLISQKLTGSISPSIGNLTFLRVIFLDYNNLYGEIPQEIGRLSRLQNLSISRNSLGGEIPVSLSNCSNLMYLRLVYNKIGGKIPLELGSLSKLKSLILVQINVSGTIPPSLGNLSSLSQFIISSSSGALQGNIPDSLGRLTSLTAFLIPENNLSGMIPPSIYNISSLTSISVAHNQLYGSLPPNIGFTLPNLDTLLMGENHFHGPIPVSLSNASHLKDLDIIENNMVGPVPANLGDLKALSRLSMSSNNFGSENIDDLNFLISLTNCSNLEKLTLDDNKFGGELPNSLVNLSRSLTVLLLGRNQIFGSIPKEIGNLVSLIQLGMELNLYTGRIPNSIGNLQKLTGISLYFNFLSGQIPSSLSNITRLSEFYVGSNMLEGSIPSSLGECKYLEAMSLSQNNLNGTIPHQVIGLSSLSLFLDLSNNSLTGSLPMEVGRLKHLRILNISHNKLSGEIPNTIGDCVMLEILSMQGNLFQGTIPQSFKSLRSIQYFDLSSNNLSGQIPKILETFTLFQYLNLSFNQLEGDVPREGVFNNTRTVSVVGNGKLCGGIAELQLPTCPIQESNKGRDQSRYIKVIIMIIILVLSLILISTFFTLYWRSRSRKNPPSTSLLGCEFLRISYQDLLKATDGFSPTNLIGLGSFGSVYKGILHQDEKPVAVKVLNLQRKGGSKSFMTECEALSRIRHRNLLKIITSCSSTDFQGNDFKALVYEFMPNGSLENWLHPSVDGHQQPRKLSFGQRLNIAIDVACALDYLHHRCSTPIVHCDLKPSNILFDEDLNAHVGDFGLAKFVDNDLTSSVTLKGSIGYVAPEYGMGSQVSTRGDVYSYGIFMLETFTGKTPTDDMFKDGLSLRNLSMMALPEKVMEIADMAILLEEREAVITDETLIQRRGKIQECFASILRIGVACSTELPGDRMDISDVLMELYAINEMFLGIGCHGWR